MIHKPLLLAPVLPDRAVPADTPGAFQHLSAFGPEPRPFPGILDKQADIVLAQDGRHHPNPLHSLRDGHGIHFREVFGIPLPHGESRALARVFPM